MVIDVALCTAILAVYGCNRNAFLISGCRMRGAGYNYVFVSDPSIPSDSMKLNKMNQCSLHSQQSRTSVPGLQKVRTTKR